MVFSMEKRFGLLSFFLLLSFRSKMRMIEVFVFFEMRGRKKEKEESCETIVGNP